MDDGEGPALFSKKATLQELRHSRLRGPLSPHEVLRSDGNPPSSFCELGLPEWLVKTCTELGLKRPTPVQQHCIPQILKGMDVLGLAQTGSGKTAAFALPILHVLAKHFYGVFAVVLTPTRELAFQLSDQFKALGSGLHLRCAVVVGGLDMIEQAKALMQRPHVVIATPGRMADLLANDPGIALAFKSLKFLVLDEADRILDVGFEDELRTVLLELPSHRQTLLFSATMTPELKALHELSGEKAFFFEAYQGLKTVEELQQEYILTNLDVKDVYLSHILSSCEEKSIRSSIIFASTCRYARDYVHRVGRTARAGRGGLGITLVTQYDVELVHEIEELIGKQLVEHELEEADVLKGITKVFKAKRIAYLKMQETGFENLLKDRKKKKMKVLRQKGLQKDKKRKRSEAVV